MSDKTDSNGGAASPLQSCVSWIKGQKHLPSIMRDFHDQKEIFKAIESKYGRADGGYAVSWVNANVYVIDYFLRWMAFHGYTLQKTRAKHTFCDLELTLKGERLKKDEAFKKMLEEGLSS
jgi:hypothetical protein